MEDFARWATASALRSGANHPKASLEVNAAIDFVTFSDLFGAPRSKVEDAWFRKWHRRAVEQLVTDFPDWYQVNYSRQLSVPFNIGWAAKLVNVYLKVMVYLGGVGPDGLAQCIHPPIDSGVWKGIAQRFGRGSRIDQHLHPNNISTIGGIKKYDYYAAIIDGCRNAAEEMGCNLFEVEQLWAP